MNEWIQIGQPANFDSWPEFFENELVQLMNDDGGKSVFKENYRKTFKSFSV